MAIDKVDKMKNMCNNNDQSEKNLTYVPDLENYYDRLITEAPYIPGDTMELVPVSEIPWADPVLMKEGIKFGVRNFFAILMANTAALMFGFSVKPESVMLLKSGRFLASESSFRRYLSTAKRVGSWFGTNIHDEKSQGFKQIKAVRELHAHYAKAKKTPLPALEDMGYTPEMKVLAEAINKDLSYLDISQAPLHLLTWDPPLQFSQFDVAMTQFGFIGLIFLHGEEFGIRKDEDFKGYIHYWAVIGRLLGIEDRFNLGLHADRELFQKLYENIGLASMTATDERVICLQSALMQGFSSRLPLITLKGWIYNGLKAHSSQLGEEVWSLMGLRDKAAYYFLKTIVTVIRNSAIAKFFVHLIFGFLMSMAISFNLPKGCPF